jgi:perosamine synthetase
MVPLYKPYMPQYLPELDAILHSGMLAYGKYGFEFEKKLSAFVGEGKLLSVNSFNSAVLVALQTLGIRSGDEIIASPMACLASNQPFETVGARVVWADVDFMTGTLSPESVQENITPRTKAIFHNHFCGFPGHIDEINAIGRTYDIPIVDDAIEAFGSEYKGKIIGHTGADVTIFSFQAVRLPTTIDGGALVFKDKTLFEKALQVRDSGIDRKFFRDSMGEINPHYDITLPGFGATMSELNSYIGLQQMNDLDMLLKRQRKNASDWDEKIRESFSDFERLNKREEINPNYWVYGIMVDDKPKALKMFRDAGFYASGVHLPNNFYSVFGKKKELKGVTSFHSRFLALPCGWWL